jgi:hypothetical protein
MSLQMEAYLTSWSLATAMRGSVKPCRNREEEVSIQYCFGGSATKLRLVEANAVIDLGG